MEMRLDKPLDELCTLINQDVLQCILLALKTERDIIKKHAAKLQTKRRDGDVLVGDIDGVPLTEENALELLLHDPVLLDSMAINEASLIQHLISLGEVSQAASTTIKATCIALNRLPTELNQRSIFHVCTPLDSTHRQTNKSLFLSVSITIECPRQDKTLWTQTLRFFEHDSDVLGHDACEVYDSDQFTRDDTAKRDGFTLIGHTVECRTFYGDIQDKFSDIVEKSLDSLLADAKRTLEQTIA